MSESDTDANTPFEPVESKEETFGAETPVTGQTKMQAAWSASDDDAKLGSSCFCATRTNF